MTQGTKRLIIFIILSLLVSTQVPADEGWKVVLEKESITVYTRPAEGCPLDQFKGIAVINAPIEVCVAVLRDVPAQPRWMGDCIEARLIKTFDKNHIVAYNIINAPWPLSNRDLQIDTVFNEDYNKGRVTVSMKVYPDPIVPVTDAYVRITDFKATCILERVDGGKTRVTYINRVNPMAPVPGAVANMFVKKNPYTTLSGLRKMVTLQKYRP